MYRNGITYEEAIVFNREMRKLLEDAVTRRPLSDEEIKSDVVFTAVKQRLASLYSHKRGEIWIRIRKAGLEWLSRPSPI